MPVEQTPIQGVSTLLIEFNGQDSGYLTLEILSATISP